MFVITTEAVHQVTKRPQATVAVLAFCGIVVSVMHTVIMPLVPRLPGIFGASPADTIWAVTVTLLAVAVATPSVGRLGDMFGKRRMLLMSLMILIAGSALAATSSSLEQLIVARALQGMATGVIPLGISIMRDALPPERLGPATAVMSASLGVGGALGLPAAAFLAEQADWRVLFWVAAGLGAVAVALVALVLSRSPVSGGRFDVVGALGLSAALTCLLLGISQGAEWGWGSGRTLSLFGGALCLLGVWVPFELRHRYPLVDLRTLARRQVLLTNLASVAFGFAMFSMFLVIPQVLQLPDGGEFGFGQSMLVVGLIMAPSGLVMLATAPVSARVTRARGAKTTLMFAAVIVAVGYLLGAFLLNEIWQIVLMSTLVGAGIGLGYGAMPTLIMRAVDVTETAAANGLNMLMRAVGSAISSAVAGVVLAQMSVSTGGASLPTPTGFQVVLVIGAGAALVALGVAAFLPGPHRGSVR